MVERLLADRRVGVAERAELVGIVLEDIRVDRADRDAVRLGVLAHRGVVVILGLVPGDMDRDRGGDAGHLVNDRGVIELLAGGGGRARPGKSLEARATVGIAPAGRLDPLLLERGLDGFYVDPLRLEALGEQLVGGVVVGHGHILL